ncbi:MAG TPA: DinB family protein [Terriglobales bacterium]|nr:DinB family protein [Terriglobales bacterium]
MSSPEQSFDLATIAQLLDRYHRGIALFSEAVWSIPANRVDEPPLPGKWSARQIVCHVADCEAVAAVRYRMIAAQPGSMLSAFDQEKWEKELIYEAQPMADALAAYAAMRLHNVNMLRGLPLGHWARIATHVERGEHTLYRMVEHNATHVESHAGQVLAIRDRPA